MPGYRWIQAVIATELDDGIRRQVQVDMAEQLDRTCQPFAGAYDDATAAGGRTGLNGMLKGCRIQRMTVANTTISRSAGNHGQEIAALPGASSGRGSGPYTRKYLFRLTEPVWIARTAAAGRTVNRQGKQDRFIGFHIRQVTLQPGAVEN
jgi:hypothetical protein